MRRAVRVLFAVAAAMAFVALVWWALAAPRRVEVLSIPRPHDPMESSTALDEALESERDALSLRESLETAVREEPREPDPRPAGAIGVRAGALVEGIVVTAEGLPIARAAVRATRPDVPGVYLPSVAQDAFTDGEGRFRISAIPAGPVVLDTQIEIGTTAVGGVLRPLLRHELEHSNPGGSWLSWSHDAGELFADSIVHVELVAPVVRELVGRVLWPDGRPAAGADFRASLPHLGDTPENAGLEWRTLDESGEFRIAVVEDGPSEILVGALSDSDELCFAHWLKRAEDRVPDGPLELVLAPGREVLVRLVDDVGAPVERANVSCTPLGAGWLTLDARAVAVAASDARVRIPPGGGMELSAELEGLAFWRVACQWREGEAEPVELVLPRPSSIRGEVTGASTSKVATVRVRSRWHLPTGGDAQRETTERTDASGHFVVDGLPAGQAWVWIEGRPEDSIELELAPGEIRGGVVLR